MSDLIDRKQAILAVCSVCSAVRPEYRGEKCIHFADGCEEIERLNELPSAQPEIIRCKDCKYYFKSDEKCQLIVTRLHFYAIDKRWTEDSFCSWAERRTDE